MLYLGKENRCLYAICHGSTYTQPFIAYLRIHKLLLNEQLGKLLTILDSNFTGYTNTPIGVEGEGWWGAEKQQVNATCKVKQSDGISWSYFYGDLQPSGCFSSGDGAFQRSPKYSWMPDRTQKQATAKAARVTFNTDTCLICQLVCTAIM